MYPGVIYDLHLLCAIFECFVLSVPVDQRKIKTNMSVEMNLMTSHIFLCQIVAVRN